MITKPINSNKGSVLVISLLILLTLTILGVTALSTTVMEERMSSNTRQRNVAHQAAETALRVAEQWLGNTAGNVTLNSQINTLFDASDELYDATIASRAINWDVKDSNAWTTGNSEAITTLGTYSSTEVPGAPRYVIEYIGRQRTDALNFTTPTPGEYVFRITAIGWGPDKTTKVVLSSTFSKRLG